MTVQEATMTARDLMKNPVSGPGPRRDRGRRHINRQGTVGGERRKAGSCHRQRPPPVAGRLRAHLAAGADNGRTAGALEQHIRQEVLYREALARGYDRDDLVVRRAMQRKMEFLAASQGSGRNRPRTRSRRSSLCGRSVTACRRCSASCRSTSAPTAGRCGGG